MRLAQDEYARIAPHYDRLAGPLVRPVHRVVLDGLADVGGPLLDLCCGTGLLAATAARRGRAVVGLDHSPAMLARARAGNHGVPFVLGDGAALPFPSGRFGAAALCFALHEKPTPVCDAILAEARRVLRPGGVLVVADYRVPALPPAGLAAALVERLAGREHFAYYRRFLDAGGCRALLERKGLRPERLARLFGRTVGVYLVRV